MLQLDCIVKSNRLIMQQFQKRALLIITGVPWFVQNKELHEDLYTATTNKFKAKRRISKCSGNPAFELSLGNSPLKMATPLNLA